MKKPTLKHFFNRKTKYVNEPVNAEEKNLDNTEEVITEELTTDEVAQDKVAEKETPKIITMEFIPKIEVEATPIEKVDSDETIVNRGLEILENITKTSRIAGSSNERDVANYLLNKTEEVFGTKSALEPFYVSKWLHNYGFLIISAIFLVALIVFPFSPLFSFFDYLMCVVILINRVVFKVTCKPICKDISFNVTSKFKDKKLDKTLVIASNYSSSKNWNINRFFRVNLKGLLVSSIIIIIATLISLIILACGVKNLGLQIFTGLMMSYIIILLACFYGFDNPNKNIKHGAYGVAISFMIMDYLKNHKGLIGDNTNVVFCSFANTSGAKAFVKEHFKNNDSYSNVTVLAINDVDDYAVFGKGHTANKVYEILQKKNAIHEKPFIKGHETLYFENVGVDAAAIGSSERWINTDFNTPKDNIMPTSSEAMEDFYTYLNVVISLLKEMKEN